MMATARGQRIGIWVIVIALTIGTIGSFVAIVLALGNERSQQAAVNTAYAQYEKDYEAQKKKDYEVFSEFTKRAESFDAKSVTELKTVDLKVGEGAEITKESGFQAYYLGWNPKGKVFDSSVANNAFKPSPTAPYTAYPGAVIEGWTEGAAGMKPGGIRELTIPASMAYGEQDRSADIPPNTPLKFIIMIPTDVPIPDVLK